jgi:hypothetical protein
MAREYGDDRILSTYLETFERIAGRDAAGDRMIASHV